jgi:hypothetical protein
MMRPLLLSFGLALMSAAPMCTAQEVGRLFFTPEQRAALDARRKARVPDKPAAAAVVASPTTRVDGYVRRSQGPSTVFVNGESATTGGAADSPQIVRDRGDARVSIPTGETGSRFALRPGEILDRGSGEIRDLLGDGELKVGPRPQAR